MCSAGGFYFNLKNEEVSVDHKWFLERGYTEEQMFWAALHELSHYRDFHESPGDYMEYSFKYAAGKAKKFGDKMLEKIEQKFGATNPDVVTQMKKEQDTGSVGTMRAVDTIPYKIYCKFFNVLDDIYVNNEISRRAPRFSRSVGRSREAVRTLYREKLFPDADMSKYPRHLQFAYSLLRGDMVPDEDITVGEEVGEILNSKSVQYGGKEMTSVEFVNECLKAKGGDSIPIARRYTAIRYTLEPLFDELLMKDLEEWNPKLPEPGEPGGGEGGEPGGDPGGEPGKPGEPGRDPGIPRVINPFKEDEYDRNTPDQMDPDDIVDGIKEREEQQKEEERKKEEKKKFNNMTPQQKQEHNRKKEDRENEVTYGLPEGSMEDLRDMQKELSEEIREMSEFWECCCMCSVLFQMCIVSAEDTGAVPTLIWMLLSKSTRGYTPVIRTTYGFLNGWK